MSHRYWWSKSLKFVWDKFNEAKKVTHNDENLALNFLRSSNLLGNNPFVIISNIQLLFSDHEQNIIHYFFEEKIMEEYLKNIDFSDMSEVRDFIKDYGIYEEGIETNMDTFLSKTVNLPQFIFTIDIPFKKYGYAYILTLDKNEKVSLSCLYDYDKNIMIDEDFYLEFKRNKKEDIKVELFNFAIATLFYIKKFPSLVKEGLPKNYFDTNINVKSFIVKSSEGVRNFGQNFSKRPHIRKGHCRYLKSDRYINKQGEIILVDPTFVHGKAKTVSTHENIEKGKDIFQKLNSSLIQ